ncbi:glycoside hydrolase family 2 TIM barrel-domain containing protein [uncultured Bacteroides sp.]|uniref:glycoside hydrolase family 2 TIM barrel-domain containing protein n=1 Tax=uncultured Bacteroides sp. TaxID=162156 RepID=UPI00262A2907|nr:glycoside hydrolase family 2 TIM barrel-domain containing protein [uncultured Bacteroides sp.]
MTKKLLGVTFLGLACSILPLAAASDSDTISLDRGWLFRLGDVADASITVKKALEEEWREVNVPHDFQIEQPWVAPSADEMADMSDAGANIKSRLSARGFKEMGGGWYVRTITPDAAQKGKRVLLDFQGIMYYGDVYLNGTRIGGTDYGYVGFEIDVTNKLNYGQENTLAVYANTGEPKQSRWYTGGGLIRDVKLIYTDPQLYFMRHPLYITTKENKTVSIIANVQCTTKENTLKMHLTVTAPDGSVVKDETFDVKRNRNYRQGQELALPPFDVTSPMLWDCDTPNLYTARVELLRPDGTIAAVTSQRFGIRTVEIGPDYGLKLNGKKVLLKGYANHHTNGALGAAAYPRAMEKRIKLMKEYGMNHIRTSHNPYSESFLDLCDENGILVVDELYDKWNDQYVGAGRRPFAELWSGHIQEFITRDRNHPCVVMWSLGNELQSYSDMPYNDFGVTMFKLQKTLVNRYDDTRKVTVAMHPRYRNWETDSLPCDLAKVTDVQAYNYRYMYFPGDGKRFPWMTFYQSEASVAAMGENYFSMNLDKVIGLAYWGAIDYLGESHGWPAKGWAQGVFDIALEPKPKAYYMKSFFMPDEPLVHIAVTDTKGDQMWNGVQTGNDGQSDHWNRKPGTKLNITTYTNAEEVELLVNGKSYGVKRNDIKSAKMRNQIRWSDIEYQDGYCEAIARTGGKVVARHKIETTGPAVALKIESDNPDWKADGQDLQHVRVVAVDKKGRRVQTALGEVTFTVAGNTPLVAVSSGDHNSDELNVTNKRKLYKGSVLAILRAGDQPSAVTVTATAEGLKPAKLKLSTK